jgi:hypothetical protein
MVSWLRSQPCTRVSLRMSVLAALRKSEFLIVTSSNVVPVPPSEGYRPVLVPGPNTSKLKVSPLIVVPGAKICIPSAWVQPGSWPEACRSLNGSSAYRGCVRIAPSHELYNADPDSSYPEESEWNSSCPLSWTNSRS